MSNGKESNTVVGDMMEFKGKVVTITHVDSQYKIEDLWCNWTDEMFEGKVVEDSDVKEEPKKLYNGKVVCINDGIIPEHLTVGKIYEFVNGMSRNNVGGYITSTPVKDVDELNTRLMPSKFIEVIE
jgi:hypothetical protein